MAQTKAKVDISKIHMAIRSGIPLTITTYTLPHEMELYISDVLRAFLRELHQPQMEDYLDYCLKELMNNAKKANTKRVYFEERCLDITRKPDYDIGMKDFKQETLSNIKYYLQQQRRRGLYVKVSMQTSNNKVKLEVRNKVQLTVFEYKRIHDKITRAQQYDSVEEGINQLLDDSEGAGLGLVIMSLVLRKNGLSEENYQVISENGETITRLTLPFNKKTQEDNAVLSTQFVNLINGLPEFPENISEINQLINDPESKMSDIAQRISNDVALTAELLKLVNSAAFSLSQPCRSISEAVKLVGLRGIRNLLFSIGCMKMLMIDSEDKKQMWEHSCRVAFYSYNLARNFCAASERECIEDSYVCGLLHDMGKIIFENARPEMLERMDEICKKRGVSPELFERMIAGVNHGGVGALIAEKWNFPDVIINVIRYHHNPEDAPQEFRKPVYIVYLADLLSHYETEAIEFEQFELDVLAAFKIQKEEQLKSIGDRMEAAFKQQHK
ncbi:MAG: HDOD domain-containing protein [Treponema sp.]|nr:HDOD domain-containing protein [Treponema sp.]